MNPTTTPKPTPSTGPRSRLSTAMAVLVPRLRRARVLIRAFRRTRPFWGGLWLLLGGWLVLRLSLVTAQVVLVSGLSGFGGWLTGGGMILCGLAAWSAPSQRYVVGIVGVLLAITSLIISNLGGLFVGMLFGVIGGTMTLAWGPKRAPRPRRLSIGLVGLVERPRATSNTTGSATEAADAAPEQDPDRGRPAPRPEPGAARAPRPGRA